MMGLRYDRGQCRNCGDGRSGGKQEAGKGGRLRGIKSIERADFSFCSEKSEKQEDLFNRYNSRHAFSRLKFSKNDW